MNMARLESEHRNSCLHEIVRGCIFEDGIECITEKYINQLRLDYGDLVPFSNDEIIDMFKESLSKDSL